MLCWGPFWTSAQRGVTRRGQESGTSVFAFLQHRAVFPAYIVGVTDPTILDRIWRSPAQGEDGNGRATILPFRELTCCSTINDESSTPSCDNMRQSWTTNWDMCLEFFSAGYLAGCRSRRSLNQGHQDGLEPFKQVSSRLEEKQEPLSEITERVFHGASLLLR